MGNRTTFRIETAITVLLPSIPNFIQTKDVGGTTIDVADVSDEQLKRIGSEWTNELLANAKLRRLDQKP